jgi:hypothetical protein
MRPHIGQAHERSHPRLASHGTVRGTALLCHRLDSHRHAEGVINQIAGLLNPEGFLSVEILSGLTGQMAPVIERHMEEPSDESTLYVGRGQTQRRGEP